VSLCRRLAALLALASLLVPQAVRAGDEQRRLEQIRAEIEEREGRARAYADEAEGYLGELEAMDRDLAETRRSVRMLRHRRERAEEELSEARVALGRADQLRKRTQRELEMRLVALYKSQTATGIPALYTAGDVQDFARRRDALARVLEYDQQLFRRHREAEQSWRTAHAESEALVAELRGASRELASRDDRIRKTLVERRNLVALLQSRSEREHKAAGELRRAAERLSEAIRTLPERGGPASGSGLAKGTLPAPVSGPVRLAFGRQVDAEFGTQTVRNGIEISADPGAEAHAVAPGRALFSGAFRGYGQLVIVDHGRGHVTVSGYLDDLQVEAGEPVREGQVLGRVAETGPIGPPGLYFEIRVDGSPVDPQVWLRP
jgi:septal ring factor EnvC (AmiA/AmiB activator)